MFKRKVAQPSYIFENGPVMQQNFKIDSYRRTGNLRYSETLVARAALNDRLATSVTLLLVLGIRRRTDMFLQVGESDLTSAGFTDRHKFVLLL
jgi:hypothetical protein